MNLRETTPRIGAPRTKDKGGSRGGETPLEQESCGSLCPLFETRRIAGVRGRSVGRRRTEAAVGGNVEDEDEGKELAGGR